MRVRQTEMTDFTTCRRMHWFRYVHNVVPAPSEYPVTNRDTGTAFHLGVAEILRGAGLGGAYAAIDKFVADESGLDREDYKRDPDWSKVHDYATAMVTNYQGWRREHELPMETLAVEHAWELNPMRGITLHGTIDAVLYDPLVDHLILRDYKTVSSFGQTPKEVDFQLRTYAYAWWKETGNVPRRAEHLMAKRVKRVKSGMPFERFQVPIDETILRRHEGHLMQRLSEIQQCSPDVESYERYPNAGPHCDWKCSYKDVCPMVDDGSDYLEVLDLHYVPSV